MIFKLAYFLHKLERENKGSSVNISFFQICFWGVNFEECQINIKVDFTKEILAILHL